MNRPTLFYYVHAHGNGHRATFKMLYPELSHFFEVIAITTNSEITRHLKHNYHARVLELPTKYPVNYSIPTHTFSIAFEVTPYAVEPAVRAKSLAETIEQYKPKAFYCDGNPELAIMARGMGVPVVLVHLPGDISGDPTQRFAHDLADHIVAHFPAFLEPADYSYASKTFYTGYLSKYAGMNTSTGRSAEKNDVTILLGYDNFDLPVLQRITANEEMHFTVIGNRDQYDLGQNCKQLGIVKDIAGSIAGDVVISAAGQNSVAELLSLGKRLVLLPESRPYDEQIMHTAMLAKQNIAIEAKENWSSFEWTVVIREAMKFNADYKKLISASGAYSIALKMNEWYN